MVASQYNQPKRPGDLDLSTLKVVSESGVTWATSLPILVFLSLSVLLFQPMHATDRRQTKASLKAPHIRGGGIKITQRKKWTLVNSTTDTFEKPTLRERRDTANFLSYPESRQTDRGKWKTTTANVDGGNESYTQATTHGEKHYQFASIMLSTALVFYARECAKYLSQFFDHAVAIGAAVPRPRAPKAVDLRQLDVQRKAVILLQLRNRLTSSCCQ